MEENTQLPKEVVEEIEKQAEVHNARLKEHAESEKDEAYAQGFAEGWHEGATTYATKLHQANETIKVLTYDNNRLKGEVEGLQNAVEELKGMIMRHAIAFANWLLPSGCIANEKDYELFLMKPEAVLDESAAGREEVDPQELWDEHSALIGDDIDDLSFWAGKEVMTKEDFFKAFKQQKEK